jgi:succinate dehydrogenase/fumarate reductase flavoprotein subunit
LAWEKIGIVRDEGGLKGALRSIESMKIKCKHSETDAKIGEDMVESFRTTSILEMAECIARAALMRRESRGAHSRSDFPSEDGKWVANICCRKVNDKVVLSISKPKEMSGSMKKLVGKPKPKVHLLE